MVFAALSMVVLFAFAGLAIDGGRAYAERRQQQNAADAAAMAGTHELERFVDGTDAGVIMKRVMKVAGENGSDPGSITCELVDEAATVLQECPSPGSATSLPPTASGVKVELSRTEETAFIRVVGPSQFTAAANATAQVQALLSGNSPFMVCANAPGHPAPLLVKAGSPPSWVVNTGAISSEYHLYGNDIKDDGRDCGNGSSSFRGLIDVDEGPYRLNDFWKVKTGNETGPINKLVASGSPCSGEYDTFNEGCVLVVPLCTHGNGETGSNFEAYCVRFGAFEITFNENHDIRGVFLGAAVVTEGQGGGAPVDGEARLIKLTQ